MIAVLDMGSMLWRAGDAEPGHAAAERRRRQSEKAGGARRALDNPVCPLEHVHDVGAFDGIECEYDAITGIL